MAVDRDGVVRNNRQWCRDWEHYRLVRADTLDGLGLLRRYSWLSHSDRRIIALAAQPIDFGRERPGESSALAATLAPHASEFRRQMVFGPARVRLVGKDPCSLSSERNQSYRDPRAQVQIRDETGITHDFSRFMPLVYYCVHGDESFYERLRLSLTSLAKYGCFGGTIGVACDRSPDELIKYIPETFQQRLIVSKVEKDRSWFHQDCLDRRLYDAYQPILYCDVDVVFDASITDLLIDILLRGEVCCASNGGVVGFENCAQLSASSDIERMTGTWQNSDQPQSFGDRPIANKMPNTGDGNFDILEKYYRLLRAPEDVVPAGRRGLAQLRFASRAGSALAETSVMTSYLDDLNLDAASEDDLGKTELNLSIPGRLDAKELEHLARLARRVSPNGCIVETGSSFGRSSWTFAKNSPANVTLYCLDPWESIEELAGQRPSLETFKKNMSGILNVIPLRGYSPRDFIGWQRTIDLFFENKAYANPALHQSLTFWTRFVRPGGCICGHGYSDEFPDVKVEVDQLAAALGMEAKVIASLWSIRVPDDPVAEEV